MDVCLPCLFEEKECDFIRYKQQKRKFGEAKKGSANACLPGISDRKIHIIENLYAFITFCTLSSWVCFLPWVLEIPSRKTESRIQNFIFRKCLKSQVHSCFIESNVLSAVSPVSLLSSLKVSYLQSFEWDSKAVF